MIKSSSRSSLVPFQCRNFCTNCQQTFTVVTRRHHCRNCGQTFCGRCSKYRVVIPALGANKTRRVCKPCHDQFSKEKADRESRMSLSNRSSSSDSTSLNVEAINDYNPTHEELLPSRRLASETSIYSDSATRDHHFIESHRRILRDLNPSVPSTRSRANATSRHTLTAAGAASGAQPPHPLPQQPPHSPSHSRSATPSKRLDTILDTSRSPSQRDPSTHSDMFSEHSSSMYSPQTNNIHKKSMRGLANLPIPHGHGGPADFHSVSSIGSESARSTHSGHGGHGQPLWEHAGRVGAHYANENDERAMNTRRSLRPNRRERERERVRIKRVRSRRELVPLGHAREHKDARERRVQHGSLVINDVHADGVRLPAHFPRMPSRRSSVRQPSRRRPADALFQQRPRSFSDSMVQEGLTRSSAPTKQSSTPLRNASLTVAARPHNPKPISQSKSYSSLARLRASHKNSHTSSTSNTAPATEHNDNASTSSTRQGRSLSPGASNLNDGRAVMTAKMESERGHAQAQAPPRNGRLQFEHDRSGDSLSSRFNLSRKPTASNGWHAMTSSQRVSFQPSHTIPSHRPSEERAAGATPPRVRKTSSFIRSRLRHGTRGSSKFDSYGSSFHSGSLNDVAVKSQASQSDEETQFPDEVDEARGNPMRKRSRSHSLPTVRSSSVASLPPPSGNQTSSDGRVAHSMTNAPHSPSQSFYKHSSFFQKQSSAHFPSVDRYYEDMLPHDSSALEGQEGQSHDDLASLTKLSPKLADSSFMRMTREYAYVQQPALAEVKRRFLANVCRRLENQWQLSLLLLSPSSDADLPMWLQDQCTRSCQLCQRQFSFFRRRHHCRLCGGIFCRSCASKYDDLPKFQVYNGRMCDSCYALLNIARYS